MRRALLAASLGRGRGGRVGRQDVVAAEVAVCRAAPLCLRARQTLQHAYERERGREHPRPMRWRARAKIPGPRSDHPHTLWFALVNARYDALRGAAFRASTSRPTSTRPQTCAARSTTSLQSRTTTGSLGAATTSPMASSRRPTSGAPRPHPWLDLPLLIVRTVRHGADFSISFDSTQVQFQRWICDAHHTRRHCDPRQLHALLQAPRP